MATPTQIIDRTGNELGLLRLGQSLQSQDSVRISSAYDEVYAQLKKEGLATWVSTNDVPDELSPYVIALMAESCLGTYGVSKERYERIKINSSIALREIRKFTTPVYSSQEDSVDY
ncbi:MAG: hypothetical protein CV087_08790 [Candidatus Brocadia sp. WS118]|nr:MAG: hypothetical protein CV087_08790 [Candidatus Brocadia sp. WS118]